MNPKNFKDIDKRRFHVKDINDVVEWFDFKASRDAEALKVIKSYRNSSNTKSSMIKAYQRKEQVEHTNNVSEPSELVVGTLQQVEELSEQQNNDEIMDELREVIAKQEGYQDGEDTYTVRYIGNHSPRFHKNGKLVKAVDVPEEAQKYLLDQDNGEEE